MSNIFGTRFRVATFGESHGRAVGALVDGCPSGLSLSEADIQPQLDRRRPGQSNLTTPRSEADRVMLLAGVDRGLTLGSPIAFEVQNTNVQPNDYRELGAIPRPSHADWTYRAKYGLNATSGGGRASARETIARVAAGAIAEKWLTQLYRVEIVAWVSSVGDIDAPDLTGQPISRAEIDAHPARCPDAPTAANMARMIAAAQAAQDSVGGIITCVCRNTPAGWGEPVFNKLNAMLAHAMMSIPAAKGFEVGSGFAGVRRRASQENDLFAFRDGRLRTRSNNSGGIQGGISNGENIVMRIAFKPTATIALKQDTVDYEGRPVELRVKGRHDPCILPRAVPVVEGMAALVLADAALHNMHSCAG